MRRAVLLLSVLGFATAGSLPAQFTYFPLTARFDEPRGICLGPDGNVWFTAGGGSERTRVGRITLDGAATEFTLPDPTVGSGDIVAGPDGNLWFIEGFARRVGRITPSGALTEFPIPGNASPSALVVGPDGAIWVSDFYGAIWRVSLSGSFTKYPIAADPFDLATGSDGNLWFTDELSNRIGRMTVSGAVTLFSRPSPEQSWRCELGPDGNIWYSVIGRKFGRITASGAITEFQFTGDRGREATSVAVGPDGNLWMPDNEDFVCPHPCSFDYSQDGILRVSTDGVQTRYALPQNWITELAQITAGPQGSMWFTAQGGIVRFFPVQLAALEAARGIPATGSPGRLTLIALLALGGYALLRR